VQPQLQVIPVLTPQGLVGQLVLTIGQIPQQQIPQQQIPQIPQMYVPVVPIGATNFPGQPFGAAPIH